MKLQANVNRLSPYLFLAPAALVLVFALLYPIGYTVVASFFDWRMGVPFAQASWAGWGNYIWLFNDPDFFESLGVTISFAFSVVVLEMVIGVGLALLLERPIRGMSVFRTVFILPMMIAPIVVGLMWRYMYSFAFTRNSASLTNCSPRSTCQPSLGSQTRIGRYPRSSSPTSGSGRPSYSSSRSPRCNRCRARRSKPRASMAPALGSK